MSASKDLIGKVFGKLTVIEKTNKKDNTCIVWKCRCECGSIKEVNTARLNNGNTRSCGCLQNGFNNIKGKKFGKLTVIEQTKERRYGNIVWKCKCDCGKESLVIAPSLLSGSTTSCGCIGLEKLQESRENNFIEDTNISKISNKKSNKNSTSGIKGVYWISTLSMWEVQIDFQKKTYHLGQFKEEDKDKAIMIRKLAEEKLHVKFLDWYNSLKVNKK